MVWLCTTRNLWSISMVCISTLWFMVLTRDVANSCTHLFRKCTAVPHSFNPHGRVQGFDVYRLTWSFCLLWEGPSLSSLIGPPDDMFNSAAPSTVLGYQVDNFTCSWSVEHFNTHWQVYPGLMDMLSTLVHFPFKWGCKNYTFLDKAVEDFEFDADSISMDTIKMPWLDT